MPILIQKIKNFFYPQESADDLQNKVDSDNNSVCYAVDNDPCDNSVQTCPLQDIADKNVPSCQFSSISAYKAGRVFKYEWKKDYGIIKEYKKSKLSIQANH